MDPPLSIDRLLGVIGRRCGFSIFGQLLWIDRCWIDCCVPAELGVEDLRIFCTIAAFASSERSGRDRVLINSLHKRRRPLQLPIVSVRRANDIRMNLSS